MDFFHIIVDVLARRYSWSFTGIGEDMYWEDVYAMYEYASNLECIEKNQEMKFNFALHAQVENALDNWEDSQIPFPDTKKRKKKKGQSDLPKDMQKHRTSGIMTPERQARYEEVLRKVAEANKRRQNDINDEYDDE